MSPPTQHAPASTFVPAALDGSSWDVLQPYYAQLIGRTVHDAASLERLLLDRSELDAAADEAAANLYIEMTRHTDDELARKRYLEFVEQVEPELKKAAFALDRKIVECPFAQQLDQARYGILLRGLRRSVEIFREENIPLETEITKLDQKYSEANGAMTVEFDGEERTLVVVEHAHVAAPSAASTPVGAAGAPAAGAGANRARCTRTS